MQSLAGADLRAIRMINYRSATDRQIGYARHLIAERQTNLLDQRTWRPIVMAVLNGDEAEFGDVSMLIDALKNLPFKTPEPKETLDQSGHNWERLQRQASESRKPWPNVAEGRYALRNVPGYKNEITFFKVDRPTEGRWAGRTFGKQFSSDEEMPVRGEGARKVLELIAQDPKAAMILFGRESSRCGHCGRRLTDDESRARGIGPICADNLGW